MYGLGNFEQRATANALMPQGQWGQREDGTQKGRGWLGPIQRPDGDLSTELSAGMNIDGKETLVPLMVPTLDPAEVQWLLSNKAEGPEFFKQMPPSILQKAAAHASQRIKLGQSPFVD
jgi:hypothetical protein